MPDSEIESVMLDETVKGIQGGTRPFRLGDIRRQNWNILREDLVLPVAVIRKSAIDHNSKWMQRFLARVDALHCPHGKTLVSPQIYDKQLSEGAWGITVATVHQLQVCRHFEVRRILFANQLVGRPGIRYVIEELARDRQFDFYCLVDSVEGVNSLASAVQEHGQGRPIQVLIETGFTGGRAGCRDMESALAVARAVKAFEPDLVLCGVETYAGLIDEPTSMATAGRVAEVFEFAARVVEACDQNKLLGQEPAIFCAGSSHYFDMAPAFARVTAMKHKLRTVIRSGSYLYFDSSWYAQRFTATYERMSKLLDAGQLQAAVEIWGYIQSLPEARRAIVGIGRRETSFAFGMPVPLLWFRPGAHDHPQLLPNGHLVTALNDHHAFLDLPANSPLRYGDMVSLGISMPSATFDRWRFIFVIDDDYNVVSALQNFS